MTQGLRVLELFGGIGAFTKALERQEIPHTVVDYVEIDRYAVDSYNAIHGAEFQPQDVTKWSKDVPVDFIMHGSPCQDFSLAGRQAGGDEGSGTRSSLLYETLRIVEKTRPRFVLWENVRNLVSKRHRHNFQAYLDRMEEMGYENSWRIMNAKDYGIPQNRERVFVMSIKRTEATPEPSFAFPEPEPLQRRLVDFLEQNPDEKYYLSEQAQKTYQREFGSKGKKLTGDTSPTLTASMGTGGANTPWLDEQELHIKTANSKGYDTATHGDGVDLAYPDSTTPRGRVGHGVAKTIPTSDSQGTVDNGRIRKLTPRECWRLMGFDDEDYAKAAKVNSATQLYKQAGNSIVVNVLEKIINQLPLGAERTQ